MKEQRVDPFADSIVTEPRSIEPAVESLNRRAMDQMLAAFADVTRQPIPRLQPSAFVELVTSAAPGYGKSHLIGRLFRKLDDDATLVYVRPFRDPSTAWTSLLSKTVAELEFPDQADKLCVEPGDLTQLDMLARRVLVNLVLRLLATGKGHHPEPTKAIQFFNRYPNAVFETPEWRDWLHAAKDKTIRDLTVELKSLGIQLVPNNGAWITVLFAYAFSEHNPELRQVAIDWLNASPLDPGEGELLGLRKADLPIEGATPEQRNETAFERIRDLFKLGSFYRPFLLCFDQTEVYAGAPELAHSLGTTLSRLRREAVNHLVVVTANQFVWDEVLKEFEVADQHCLRPEPIRLLGIDAAQARELLQQRLVRCRISDDATQSFLNDSWLPALFAMHRQRSVRDVLRAASEHWGSARKPNLPALYDSYRRRLLADPKRLDYDAGVFQWLLEQVIGPSAGLQTEHSPSAKGYLTLRWHADRREARFGFEAGNHHRRWEAIYNESDRLRQQAAHEGKRLRVAFFRTPLQKPLAKRNLTQIDAADGQFFRVLSLAREQAADLYAAHDLHADVLQGNQEFTPDEVVEFLQTRLRHWADEIIDAKVLTVHPTVVMGNEPDELPQRVRDIVQSAVLITLPLLLQRLPQSLGAAEADVLTACSKVSEIRVFSAPQCTVIHWTPYH
jgi:hypothetical protein